MRDNWCHAGCRLVESVALSLHKLQLWCQLALLPCMHPHCAPAYCIISDDPQHHILQSVICICSLVYMTPCLLHNSYCSWHYQSYQLVYIVVGAIGLVRKMSCQSDILLWWMAGLCVQSVRHPSNNGFEENSGRGPRSHVWFCVRCFWTRYISFFIRDEQIND